MTSIELCITLLGTLTLFAFLLISVFFPTFLEKGGILELLESQRRSDRCVTDADCVEGVCVGGRCTCYVDEDCVGSCFMPLGYCR